MLQPGMISKNCQAYCGFVQPVMAFIGRFEICISGLKALNKSGHETLCGSLI